MALNTFEDVKVFIDKVLTDIHKIGGVKFSPHGAFWNDLSYEEFVNGNVPGVQDPNTGAGILILQKGRSAESTLILSLQGKGPLFDPISGAFPRMPANGPPYFSTEQIAEIADWIDRGCPK